MIMDISAYAESISRWTPACAGEHKSEWALSIPIGTNHNYPL
jgi:hypothetical protein